MIESVPLIQNANDAQQINASIIAMKKASKELDEKILKLNNLNKELDKKIAVLDNGLAQEITDRENADSAEVTNRNTAITNAVNSLDVAGVGGSGKYISAISETDGKISATVSDLTSVIESGNNQPATSNAVYNFNKITINNSNVGEIKDVYILLNPSAINSYNKVGSYEFHIMIQRGGNSNSKNVIINFLSSYDGAEGQNILHCGIREGINNIYAKIVKITYNEVSYFALKVKVYDWSSDEIYYKYKTRYSSDLLFKIVNSSDISNESDVSYINLYQNGTLL
jgi:hypothetical protein